MVEVAKKHGISGRSILARGSGSWEGGREAAAATGAGERQAQEARSRARS